MKLRVANMSRNAGLLVQRAAQTKGGTFIFVGYNGEQIVAAEKVRKSMPHERVDILPGETVEQVEVKLALAVARLRKPIAEAIKVWKTPPPPRNRKDHAWAAKGLLKKPR